MAYGLYQGLNEAYKSYRSRERDIEDERRRAFEDELREEANQRARATESRAAETYQYGVSRRPIQEQAQELQLEQAQLSLDEWKQNAPLRAEQNQLALQQAQQELKLAGININNAEIANRAAKGAEKYRQWGREWMSGGTMEDLVKKFNSDDDDSNNVRNVRGNEKTGWEVEMENGERMFFADRDQVGIHIESHADPAFYQRYLLQMEAQKASLAEAVRKGSKKTADTVSKERQQWEQMTVKQVDRFFAKSISEGIIDFGTAGSRDMAGDVRATVDAIGMQTGYGVLNSDVTRVANQMAKTMLIKEPEEREMKAREFLETQREAGYDIPDEDSKEYQQMLDRRMAEDYDMLYDQYQRAVFDRFLQFGPEGEILMKNYGAFIGQQEPEGSGASAIPVPTRDTPEPEAPVPPQGRENMGLQPRAEAAAPVRQAEMAAIERIKEGMAASAEKRKTGKIKRQEQQEFAKQRAKEFGYRARGKQSVDDKRKIKADFDQNFATMSEREQEMWFNSFAYALSAADRKTAKGIMAAD